MTQRPRPHTSLRIMVPACLAGLLAFASGCHFSSGVDGLDGGVDAGDDDVRATDSASPFDGGVPDARPVDAAERDGGVDAALPCPESSTIESFHAAEDETRYGRALALSGDGSTLAVSSQDSVSIYDRSEEGWSLVYRRTVFLTGPGRHLPGGVAIDESGDTMIWGATISTEASPDFSAALVFERADRGEWRETTLEATPGTLPNPSGVSISGDGSTLAVREDGIDVQLRLFERGEDEGWLLTQTLVAPSFNSVLDSTIEFSFRGDRVAWHTSGENWIGLHRRDASGEWLLEFEILGDGGPAGFAFDAAGARLVVRTASEVWIYDREETTWAESSRISLPDEGAFIVPSFVAVSRSGDEIYASNSTECGVAVWSWTQRDLDWTEAPTRYAGVEGPDAPSRFPVRVGEGTIALSVSESRGADAVGVYLLR